MVGIQHMDVEVAELPVRGRHLKAAKFFAAGQIVLRQQPYAAVLYDDCVPHRCDYCYCLCDKPLRCSKSKLARYCSREHQRSAWLAGYNTECEALAKLAPKIPPPTIRLACRALWRRQRDLHGDDNGILQSYAAIEELLDHWDELDEDRKSTYAQMVVVTRELYTAGGVGVPPETKDIAKLLARFACNNHTICDEELRPIGVGIYPLGALINHSCQPNCMQSFQGSTICFRAIRAIQLGEEITISYVELAAPRWERREALRHLYFFDIDQSADSVDQPVAHDDQAADSIDRPVTHDDQPIVDAGRPAARALGDSDGSQSPTTQPAPPSPTSRNHAVGRPELPSREPGSSSMQHPSDAGVSGMQHPSGARVGGESQDLQLLHGDTARLLPSCAQPPWRWDPVDLQLSALVSGSGRLVQGGIYVNSRQRPVEVHGFGCEEDDSGGEGEEGSAGAPTPPPVQHELLEKDRKLLRRLLGSSSQQPAAEPALEVVCWGRWCGAHGGVNVAAVAQAAAHMHKALQQAEALSKAGQCDAAVRALQPALSMADDMGGGGCKLGPAHILRLHLLAALLKAAVDSGDRWQEALQAARALAPIYAAVYPKVWPNLGLHYAMLAKLENLVGEPQAAASACGAALESLKVTHPDSALLDELLHMQHQISKELEMESQG